MATKYTVLNPRGIPVGFRILRIGGRTWDEGDEFVSPRGFSADEVADLERRGFLAEKKEMKTDG